MTSSITFQVYVLLKFSIYVKVLINDKYINFQIHDMQKYGIVITKSLITS